MSLPYTIILCWTLPHTSMYLISSKIKEQIKYIYIHSQIRNSLFNWLLEETDGDRQTERRTVFSSQRLEKHCLGYVYGRHDCPKYGKRSSPSLSLSTTWRLLSDDSQGAPARVIMLDLCSPGLKPTRPQIKLQWSPMFWVLTLLKDYRHAACDIYTLSHYTLGCKTKYSKWSKFAPNKMPKIWSNFWPLDCRSEEYSFRGVFLRIGIRWVFLRIGAVSAFLWFQIPIHDVLG